jgi:hypothetical protein
MTTEALQTERVVMGRLWWVGLLAMGVSITANLVVRLAALAVFDVHPEFAPLAGVGPTMVFTTLGVLGAVVVFAVLGRFARRPLRVFRVVAVLVLVLSFLPDFWLLAARDRLPFPGTTLASVATLMFMHVVAAAIAVGMLTTTGRRQAV